MVIKYTQDNLNKHYNLATSKSATLYKRANQAYNQIHCSTSPGKMMLSYQLDILQMVNTLVT